MQIVPRSPFDPSRRTRWALDERADEGRLWLSWIVRFRWVAIFGQAITLSFTVGILDSPAVVVPLLFGLMLFEAILNVFTQQRLLSRDHVPQVTLLTQLLLDVTVLTGFFLAAGGHENPFVMLYVIHIAMAGLMMRPPFALVLTSVVLACNGLIHEFHLPLHPEAHRLAPQVLMPAGQVVAFTVTTLSIVFFVLGMSDTLRLQKQKLIAARERTARTDRLRSLGTLAAGAAHELNTPLSTMGLRLRRVTRRHDDEETQQDVAVIDRQLKRCVDIVEQLLIGAGDPSASGIERAPLADFVQSGIHLWTKGSPLDVEFAADEDSPQVAVPRVAFLQAFINLLENAREAQEEAGVFEPLRVRVAREGDMGVVRVIDQGPGLPDEIDRIGEPFYTTKPTGTGLGVFVARSVADGAGGGLSYERAHGATVTRWWFPDVGRST